MEIGGRRVEGVLGEGGSSVVYRCAGGVALKVLREELRGDPGVAARFRGEAQALAAVRHRNVVRLVDAGEWWIAMELVDGPSLLELAPLPVDRACALVAQAGWALEGVHEAGYVHRDVKPGNLLVDGSGRVVLIDFALARRVDSAEPWVTDDGRWLGTPDFAAPEQIRGLAVDPRSDVYSLGAVLHWAVTREVPFPREDPEATMRAHLEAEPPASHPAVAHAMAKDPADRHPSAAAFSRSVLD